MVLHRWKLCTQALVKLDLVGSALQEQYIRGKSLCKDSSDAYVNGSTASESIVLRTTAQIYRSRTGFYVANLFAAIYGSIHLALWNFYFPITHRSLAMENISHRTCQCPLEPGADWTKYLFSRLRISKPWNTHLCGQSFFRRRLSTNVFQQL